MPGDIARHLLDRGLLCTRDDEAASSLHPGIVVMPGRIEARLVLRHQETTFAHAKTERDELAEERTPTPLAALWSSDQPQQKQKRRPA